MKIGVFDSGLGGLSVLGAIRRRLPGADLDYVADSAHVPYGDKGEDFIRERSRSLADFLLAQGAEVLVVACNTATAAAVPNLRAALAVPVVGMEPAVKPATLATRTGIVGVMATVGTLKSARFAALLDRFGAGIQVLTQACPGLVEQVEAADLEGRETRQLVQRFVGPLLAGGADTLVLGCTHFHFLRPLVQAEAGPDVTVIDTADAVARQVARVAGSPELPAAGRARFWTSGDAVTLQRPLAGLWGGMPRLMPLPETPG
ncbi:MAG: glutamate racemase [Gammaproteobacteria bacterium]